MGNRTNNEFDFFHGREADQYSFYRIPKLLFTDKRFSKVSLEAKLLYGLLLDRMSLSTKNGWIDKDDRVYIYFKLEDAINNIKYNNTEFSDTYPIKSNPSSHM